MATITITAPDENGKLQTAAIEYDDAFKGQLMQALSEHFCYPDEIEQDGKKVPNPQTRFQYVAERISGDLIRLAFQQPEQQAMEAARKKIQTDRDAALKIKLSVAAAKVL